ncbi:MAG: toll/interleukin-1 receptor domain-containing protein [Pseudomonadota bacterium]
MKVFLSYKSEEVEIAERLQKALEERGHDVWRDNTDIEDGTVWMEEINQALLESERLVAMYSNQAFQSEIVHDEFMHGLSQKTAIGVITDRPSTIAPPFNQVPVISIYNWLTWEITADIDYLSEAISLPDERFQALYPSFNHLRGRSS